MTERPLVSFCLQAYNQREYIDAALEGAFAQTYRPLEIVISDDCSTDGTWERIQEKVKGLGEGEQRTIILHRNEKNVKNIKNLEVFGTLAHGELFIKADSDDVSEPERVAKIVQAWVKDGKRAKVVSVGYKVIDTEGKVLGERYDASINYPVGAMQAWVRDCFVGWPEVPPLRTADDVVWCARAMLLGGEELVLHEPLVRYRVGSGLTTRGTSYRKALARIHHTEVEALPICLRDVDAYLAKGGDKARAEAVRANVRQRADCAEAWLKVLEGRFVWTRLAGARRVWRFHRFRGHILLLLLCLPFHLGDPIVARLRKTA